MKPFRLNTLRPGLWSETLVSRSAIALVLMMLIAILRLGGAKAEGAKPLAGQAPSSSASAVQTQSYEGVVTDTHCGAKHSAAIGKAAADCTRICIHGGEQFALVDGDSVYVLQGDLAALKKVAGQRVRIVGTLNGSKISVSAVARGE